MELQVREWGEGERAVILLHGMMGSSESWWRVGPALAALGNRVLAMDLPGHGHSPRDLSLTVERAAAAVVATAGLHDALKPSLAIGHSFGGLVLTAALSELQPMKAILVDSPLSTPPGTDPTLAHEQYELGRRARNYEELRRTRPHYSDKDARVEAAAAQQFDAETAAALSSAASGSWPAPAGTLVIRARPSNFVSDEDANAMRQRGVIVHDVPGASHAVWCSHFDEFMDLLPR
ncbi:alpha/beta fold hydrolase [Paenarthrobacter sp. NPDC091711]|uniref:alpha/beta fold hydrolase n=1 Tax=Paenarthrobacter sp. NPDC091711 TaxID=3364385 RepID=UPI00381FCF38